MPKPWTLYGGLAILALILWKHHEADLRNEGASREIIAGLNARNAKLEDEAGRIDTVYFRDTVRLSHTRVRVDSIIRTDTVFSRSTVTQIVKDERAACSAVIATCERAKANLVAQLANRDSVITAIQKQRPGWFKRTFGCAAGIAATPKGTGLGAACGVRFP